MSSFTFSLLLSGFYRVGLFWRFYSTDTNIPSAAARLDEALGVRPDAAVSDSDWKPLMPYRMFDEFMVIKLSR